MDCIKFACPPSGFGYVTKNAVSYYPADIDRALDPEHVINCCIQHLTFNHYLTNIMNGKFALSEKNRIAAQIDFVQQEQETNRDNWPDRYERLLDVLNQVHRGVDP